jgi:N-hydroxyarylamine O-acetyltransferase
MSELDVLFRKRVGFPEKERLTFSELDDLLEKTARTIPFENLAVMENRTQPINRAQLADKILSKKEGGLCYELNALLYFFMADNGFGVSLHRGAVYDHSRQDWALTGRTHINILLNHEGAAYLMDTGFGGHLPLKPVPLNGEEVTSATGEFRLEQAKSDYGDYLFMMKLRDQDSDFKIGYAFDSQRPIKGMADLDDIQKIITQHPESHFTKNPLATRMTDEGRITLTDTSFTEWKNGEAKKSEVDEKSFPALLKQHFGLNCRV